jgi:hypothetical protein
VREDTYELCLRHPERCAFGLLVAGLVEEAGLEECVRRSHVAVCLKRCLERCGGGEVCGKACRAAVDAAVAKDVAESVLKGAVEVVLESKLAVSMSEAAAALVSGLLRSYVNEDCAAKTMLFHVAGRAIVVLQRLIKPDLVVLLAPLISTVYGCVGEEEVDGLLEEVRAAVGEKAAEAVSAALDSGEAAVERVLIRFPPVR